MISLVTDTTKTFNGGDIENASQHAVIAERQPALDEKVRDFLRVRNRKGQPCPRCGTTIRAAGVRG